MTPTTKKTAKTGIKGSPSGAWVLSEETLLTRLHELSDELNLTPAQAAVVLQVDEDWLRKSRQKQSDMDDGEEPLPFIKLPGGRNAGIRYNLGDLRKALAARRVINTRGGRVCGFVSLADFMSRGLNDDAWLFAIPNGARPIDFFEALRLGVEFDKVEWLTLAAYLDAMPGCVARDEAATLGEGGVPGEVVPPSL